MEPKSEKVGHRKCLLSYFPLYQPTSLPQREESLSFFFLIMISGLWGAVKKPSHSQIQRGFSKNLSKTFILQCWLSCCPWLHHSPMILELTVAHPVSFLSVALLWGPKAGQGYFQLTQLNTRHMLSHCVNVCWMNEWLNDKLSVWGVFRSLTSVQTE